MWAVTSENVFERRSRENCKHVRSSNQTAAQRQKKKTTDQFLTMFGTFKYVGIIVTNQNYVHEELKSRNTPGTQTVTEFRTLSTPVLSKEVRIQM
jgi:hypothetical protein